MQDLFLVLVIVLIVALVWRGPKTLPQLGRALGQGVRGARREIDEIKGDHGAADTTATAADRAATPPPDTRPPGA